MTQKTILLVDDTRTALMFESMALSNLGAKLETAKDGHEALAKVAAGKPDLILLDIMMPGIDGIETCRRIKQDPATQQIPIVMVTTKGQEDMVNRAYEAGCDAYLTKPLTREELVESVTRYLTGAA